MADRPRQRAALLRAVSTGGALACLVLLAACAAPLEPLTISVEERAGTRRVVPLVIDGRCFWESRGPDAPDLPLERGSHPAALDLTGPQPVLQVGELRVPLAPGAGCR